MRQKGPLSAGQVSDEKTSMCKPLLTHRKTLGGIETGGDPHPQDKGAPGGCSLSQGAACVLPWRCPVYRWRELVAGAGMEQENLSPRYRFGRSAGVVQLAGEREGGPQAADTVRGRVPMRGTGAGRFVVAMKAL